MKENLKNKSNSELVMIAQELKHEYEAKKARMLNDLDRIDTIETEFRIINDILKARKQ